LSSELAFASAYGAAQAALGRLVESWAREFLADGIAVYALNPGFVPTGLMNRLLSHADGRRWLPRFTEAFAEGKEVGPEVAAEMAAWLIDRRPLELSGRVVAAPATPAIVESRLGAIVASDLNRLRLR
jgi:NAD(P)-dependent dehydrogenase (short-subunit alcohol dehydrogenase family)